MKKIKQFLLLAMSAVLLTGCSMTFSAEEDCVYVNKKGEILGAIVEDFSEDYYDLDELQAILDEEVSEYNAENGNNSVKVGSCKVDGGKIKIIMNYMDWTDYTNFNGVQFYVGHLYAIQGKSYGDGVNFVSKDGTQVGSLDEIDPELYVIFLEEPIVVQTCGKIEYVSDNVTVEGEKLARVSEDVSGLAFIIYSK